MSPVPRVFLQKRLIHFDETPCGRFSLKEDLIDEVWDLLRKRAKIPVDMAPIKALENLHLFKDGSIPHAGALLLANDIRKYSIVFGILHRMEAVEHIGPGIRRIRNLCQ